MTIFHGDHFTDWGSIFTYGVRHLLILKITYVKWLQIVTSLSRRCELSIKKEDDSWHLNSKGLYVKKNEDAPTYWYLDPEDAKDVHYYDRDDPEQVAAVQLRARDMMLEYLEEKEKTKKTV
jgi:hypothetical protein